MQCIILFMTSKHQTTNLVFPNHFHKFSVSQFEQLKKKTNFSLAQIGKKNCFGQPIKSLFSFQNWEKCVNKIEKNKIRGLVVWYHEQDIRCAVTFTSFVRCWKEFFKNQIKDLSDQLDINMSGSENYTSFIGIKNLSQPFENPISTSLFILLIVLGILGITCSFCLVCKFLEKMFYHFRGTKLQKIRCNETIWSCGSWRENHVSCENSVNEKIYRWRLFNNDEDQILLANFSDDFIFLFIKITTLFVTNLNKILYTQSQFHNKVEIMMSSFV